MQTHHAARATCAVILFLAAACKGDDAAPSDSSAATPGLAPAIVTVAATDFAFEAPDTIAAGVTTFRLQNKGPDLHHIIVMHLDSGKTFQDLSAAMQAAPNAPPPAWAVMVGGPNAPAPGDDFSATLDLAAGNYALLCVIPAADGVPHMMKGMVHPLTVVGPASATARPESDITITLDDYTFEFSTPVTAGPHVIRVRNAAAQPHEFLLAQLAPGKTAADLLAWLEKRQGPPPGKPMGGVTPMIQGAENDIHVDLPAGEYALICFAPDARDGKPHFAHGMVTQFAVR